MILSFMRKFEWGDDTNFARLIPEGEKPHSLRENPRWQPGMKIHIWDLGPRAVKANPKPRPISIPVRKATYWYYFPHKCIYHWEDLVFITQGKSLFDHEEAVPVCYAIEEVKIQKRDDFVPPMFLPFNVSIGGVSLSPQRIELFAHKDGLINAEGFWAFFEKRVVKKGGKLYLKLIHWTDNNLYNKFEADVIDSTLIQ